MTTNEKIGIGCLAVFALPLVVCVSVISDPRPRPPVVGMRGQVVTLQTTYCSASTEGLSEFVSWAVRNDHEEMMRTMLKFGGRMTKPGETAKVLDHGMLRSRVRLQYDDMECFVIPETYQ